MSKNMMRTIFDWDHFALYMSGPIDFAGDRGVSWRDDWVERLVKIGIKRHQIYNPCKKPIESAHFNLDNEARLTKEYRTQEDWDGLDNIMGQIMHVDLRLLDLSSLVLVNFPKIGQDEFSRDIRRSQNECEEGYQGVRNMSYVVDKALSQYENMRVPTYGTIHEIVVASQQRKPIFVVWEGEGKNGCSGWIMRLVGHENVFASVDKLMQHLDAISHGKAAFNANEWLLLKPVK